MTWMRNEGSRPVLPDTEIRVRYRNGEVSPYRAAKWWSNWRRSDDDFAIAEFEEKAP